MNKFLFLVLLSTSALAAADASSYFSQACTSIQNAGSYVVNAVCNNPGTTALIGLGAAFVLYQYQCYKLSKACDTIVWYEKDFGVGGRYGSLRDVYVLKVGKLAKKRFDKDGNPVIEKIITTQEITDPEVIKARMKKIDPEFTIEKFRSRYYLVPAICNYDLNTLPENAYKTATRFRIKNWAMIIDDPLLNFIDGVHSSKRPTILK